MQLAIIGTKEEIIEIMKYVQNMQVSSKTERVVRAEFVPQIEEQTQMQLENFALDTTKIG